MSYARSPRPVCSMTMGTRSMSFSSMKPMPHLLHKGTIPLQVVPTVPRDSHHGGGQHHAGNSFLSHTTWRVAPDTPRHRPGGVAGRLAGRPVTRERGEKAESRPHAPMRKYTDISRAVGNERAEGLPCLLPLSARVGGRHRRRMSLTGIFGRCTS